MVDAVAPYLPCIEECKHTQRLTPDAVLQGGLSPAFNYWPGVLVSSESIIYGGSTNDRNNQMKHAITIPGAEAKAFKLAQKEQIRIINLEGSQVVDAWAFCTQQPDEFMSTEHTRSCLEKLIPSVGDALYSNRRRPILSIVEDTSPGVHDLLLSACDIDRYRLLGVEGYHRNCADNLIEALAEIDMTPPEIPSPFNIFENVSIGDKGELSIQPPVVKAGDSISLQAELDVVLVLSCCPMDIALTNGPDLRSKPVQVELL